MHISSFLRDHSFYAKFYSRHPSEIEIVDKTPSTQTSHVVRTSAEIPPIVARLSDTSSGGTSGCFSSSDSSSSESTSSYVRRRRTTAPIIQERLNTYESAGIRPSLPLNSLNSSKQKVQSTSILSPPSLVNQIIPRQIPAEQTNQLLINSTNLVDDGTSHSVITSQDNSSSSRLNEESGLLDSFKRYLSKSTSQLSDCTTENMKNKNISSPTENILDIIQEELSEIRRADHDLKKMFISIYDKIQDIQQLKSSTVNQTKYQRHHFNSNDRYSRSVTHCCYSSSSDIRRMSSSHLHHHLHHHHNRKYSVHSFVALRNRINKIRTSSTADNDSYVDTDSLSSSSDSGTCSSPVDNVHCGID